MRKYKIEPPARGCTLPQWSTLRPPLWPATDNKPSAGKHNPHVPKQARLAAQKDAAKGNPSAAVPAGTPSRQAACKTRPALPLAASPRCWSFYQGHIIPRTSSAAHELQRKPQRGQLQSLSPQDHAGLDLHDAADRAGLDIAPCFED